MNAPTGTEARVCADIAQRQALGLRKYGTSVEANPLPLRAWLQHAYEETLDEAIYLRRAMEEMDCQAATRAVPPGVVYVCPTRDHECGGHSASWCAACPLRIQQEQNHG